MKNSKIGKILPPLIGILALFAAWYFACAAGVFNAYVLPSPQKVYNSFLKMVKSGELLRDIGISLGRVLKGFGIAFVIAFVLGMFRSLVPAVGSYFEYLIHFFR